jgi:hypothetical protein
VEYQNKSIAVRIVKIGVWTTLSGTLDADLILCFSESEFRNMNKLFFIKLLYPVSMVLSHLVPSGFSNRIKQCKHTFTLVKGNVWCNTKLRALRINLVGKSLCLCSMRNCSSILCLKILCLLFRKLVLFVWSCLFETLVSSITTLLICSLLFYIYVKKKR